MRLLIVFACALFLSVCQRESEPSEEGQFVETIKAEAHAGEMRRLSSDREVRVLGVSVQDGTLELTYMASVNLRTEHEPLQAEVEENWNDFLREEASGRMRFDCLHRSDALYTEGPLIGRLGTEFRLERTQPGTWKKLGGFVYSSEDRRN